MSNAVLRPSKQYVIGFASNCPYAIVLLMSTNASYIVWCSRCSDFIVCAGECSWLEPVSCCHSNNLVQPMKDGVV